MRLIMTLMGLLLAGVIHAQQPNTNLSFVAVATQSSDFVKADNAIDGVTNTFSLTGVDVNPWLELAFANTNWMEQLWVWPRRSSAPTNFWVFVSNRPFSSGSTNVATDPDVTTWHYRFEAWVNYPQKLPVRRLGRFVRFQLDGTGQLELGELQVYGRRFNGTELTMLHRTFVFTTNGVTVTQRQDGLLILGVPGVSFDLESKERLQDAWVKATNVTATNYETKWFGPRTRATGELFFRTQEAVRLPAATNR